MRAKNSEFPAVLQNTPKTKTIFAFDLDDTLIQAESLHHKIVFDQEEMDKIKEKMSEAISNGNDIWIVTANEYFKNDLKKLFGSDSELLDKIQYFNSYAIAKELEIKHFEVHSGGKKGEFLAKKIAQDPVLKDFNVHCVLFDDSDKQIGGCAVHSSEKIKLTGFRVDDYHAKDKRRSAPARRLSEIFSEFVSKAAIESSTNTAQALTQDLSQLVPVMDENDPLFDNPNSPSLHLQDSIKNQPIAKVNPLLENLILGLAIGLLIVAIVIAVALVTGGFGSPIALFLGGMVAKLTLGALGGGAAFWAGLTVLSTGIVAACTGLSGLATKLLSSSSPQIEKIENTDSIKFVNNPYARPELQPVVSKPKVSEIVTEVVKHAANLGNDIGENDEQNDPFVIQCR